MDMNKDLKDMNKDELISALKELRRIQSNRIQVADLEVESSNESLSTCKDVIQDLINKNFSFLISRKERIIRESMGYFEK